MRIYEKQNTNENIKLLAAQRHLYSQAKTVQYVRQSGIILIVAISLIIYFIFPEAKTFLAVIGGLWTIVSQLILKRIQANKIKRAATIQEQFDVELFDLPWNDLLVGERISPELINSASDNFEGNRNSLFNWYADTGNLPYPFDVILCQRANIVWDWRLRYSSGWIITGITSTLLLFEMILAHITNITFSGYFLAILIPSSSALLEGLDIAKDQFQIAKEKERLHKQIMCYWKLGLDDPKSMTREKCREVQNCIFVLRKEKSLVSNKLFSILRNEFESDMISSVNDMKSEAIKKLDLNN